MIKIITILLFFVSLNAVAQTEIFRYDPTSATGWEWKNASNVWGDLPLANGVGYRSYSGSSSTITISGEYFTNENSANINGRGAVLSNSSNITFYRCFFEKFYDLAIYLDNCTNITLNECFVANASWGFLADLCDGNIKVLNNEWVNMWGERIGEGCCRGQIIYLANSSGAGNQISWNRSEQYFGESFNEDLISTPVSSGTSGSPIRISGNITHNGGPSCCGVSIIVGDLSSQYVVVDSNKVIQGGVTGIQVAGGSHITVTNNEVWAERTRWSGDGYAVLANPDACDDITFNSNKARWEIYTTGSVSNYYNPGTCTNCSCTGPSSLGANNAAAYAAIMTGVPTPDLITFLSTTDLNRVRAWKGRTADIVDHGNTSGPHEDIDLSRPTADAGTDQSISITSATMAATATATAPQSPMTGTNTVTGLWVQVSGPNTATITTPTSATTTMTGLTTGTYEFEWQVTQTQVYNNTTFPDSYNYETWHFDWVNIEVAISSPAPGIKVPYKIAVLTDYINYKHNWYAKN